MLGIVFLFGLTVSFAKAENVVDEQPGDLVFYEKDGFIWEADLMSDTKFKLFRGHMPKLAQNGEKIAYYNKDMKPAVYNLATSTHVVLNETVMETANMQPVWSPSGKFLVVNSHTSTNNTFVVLNKKGIEKVTFDAIGSVFWINDNALVFTSMHSVATPRPRGDGGGNAFGISKINVKTGKITVLRTPDQNTDYQLFDAKSGKIRFIKSVANDQTDWEMGDLMLTYWRMNKNGKNLKEIGKLVSFADKIADILPNAYKDYYVDDFGAFQNTKWRLFTLKKNIDSVPMIFIMHYPHADTLTSVLRGYFPTW